MIKSGKRGTRLARTTAMVALLWSILAAAEAGAAQGDCAQPSSSGDGPLSSDCLFILRAAVGTATCEPECICDPNAAGGTTASDAQLCLRRAVGQDVELACPCSVTTTTLPFADVVLNEIVPDPVTGTDWIEFHNRGTGAADVSGWTLTDDDPTHSYTFSNGTVIQPGSYLVLYRDDLGSFDFGLAASGDQVNLYDDQFALVDSTAWTSGQANAPNSWGRSPDGSGSFTTLTTLTPGSANP